MQMHLNFGLMNASKIFFLKNFLNPISIICYFVIINLVDMIKFMVKTI